MFLRQLGQSLIFILSNRTWQSSKTIHSSLVSVKMHGIFPSFLLRISLNNMKHCLFLKRSFCTLLKLSGELLVSHKTTRTPRALNIEACGLFFYFCQVK